MKYLHAMVRVRDLEKSLAFYRDALGLVENRRKDYPDGRFTLVYLGAPGNRDAEVELTYNYDDEDYGGARNFGHLAFEVENIYEI
ncbi:MAG TPA: VOC family protein, partial [Turneriella sp.]|nr:VOC family protein [Turneriella sp.]